MAPLQRQQPTRKGGEEFIMSTLGKLGTYKFDKLRDVLSDPTTPYRHATLFAEVEAALRQVGTILRKENEECLKPHRSADGNLTSGEFPLSTHDQWIIPQDPFTGLTATFAIKYKNENENEWKFATPDHKWLVGLHQDFFLRKFTSLVPVYHARDLNPVSHLNPLVYQSMATFIATHADPAHHLEYFSRNEPSCYEMLSRNLDHFKFGSAAYRKLIWPLFDQGSKGVKMFIPLHAIPLFTQQFNEEKLNLPVTVADKTPLVLRFSTSEADNGLFYEMKAFGRKKYLAPTTADARSRRYAALKAAVAAKKTAEDEAKAAFETASDNWRVQREKAVEPEQDARAAAVLAEKGLFVLKETAESELRKAQLEHELAKRQFYAYELETLYEHTGYSEADPVDATTEPELAKKPQFKLILSNLTLSYAYGTLTTPLLKDLAPSLPYAFRFPNFLHTSYKMSPVDNELSFAIDVPHLPSAALLFATNRNAFDPLVSQHTQPLDRWVVHNISGCEILCNDNPLFDKPNVSVLNPQRKIMRKINFELFTNPVTGLNIKMDPKLTCDEMSGANYRYPHLFIPFCGPWSSRNLPIKYDQNTVVHDSTLPSPCRLRFKLRFLLFRLNEGIDLNLALIYHDRMRYVGPSAGSKKGKGASTGQWSTFYNLDRVHL